MYDDSHTVYYSKVRKKIANKTSSKKKIIGMSVEDASELKNAVYEDILTSNISIVIFQQPTVNCAKNTTQFDKLVKKGFVKFVSQNEHFRFFCGHFFLIYRNCSFQSY